MPVSPHPTARFSDRVEHYVRYRSGYPPEVVELLRRECRLTPEHAIADIGFGSETRLLLLEPCPRQNLASSVRLNRRHPARLTHGHLRRCLHWQ
jgi:hypothetical protein